MSDYPSTIDLSTPFVKQLDRKHRIARLLVLILFTIALTGGLAITQISVKRGLIVYSSDPKQWTAGQQIVIRTEGKSLPFRQSIQLKNVQVVIKLKKKRQPVITQKLKLSLEEMWQGIIQLPSRAGQYELLVMAEGFEHPSVTQGEKSTTPVQLNAHLTFTLRTEAQPSMSWPPLAQTPTTARERRGPGTLSFYPADQRLTSELPSTLYIIGQTDNGEPESKNVSLKMMEGLCSKPLPKALKLNRFGLATLNITPQSMALRINAEAHIDDGLEQLTSSDERFSPRAHQFNLISTTQAVKSSGKIRIDVQSTYRTDLLYLDLWWGGRWLSTGIVKMYDTPHKKTTGGLKSTGAAYISIPTLPRLKRETPQLLWLQSYLLPYQIDEVRGGAYLLWSPSSWTVERLAQWLRTKINTIKMEPSHYWDHIPIKHLLSPKLLRLALGRISRPRANPEVIINSGESAQVTAEQRRSTYMQLYLKCMVGLCLGTMIWLIMIVAFTYKRQISSPEWSDPISVKQARKIAVAWLAPMLFLLLVFFGAMILLVFKVSW